MKYSEFMNVFLRIQDNEKLSMEELEGAIDLLIQMDEIDSNDLETGAYYDMLQMVYEYVRRRGITLTYNEKFFKKVM